MSEKLDALLIEEPDHAIKREVQTLCDVTNDFTMPIVLVGVGSLGQKISSVLKLNNVNIAASTDSNPQKWGISLAGTQVLSPNEAAEKFGESGVFVICIWSPKHSYLETKAQFTKLHCKRIIHFGTVIWKFGDDILPHYQFELPHRILRNSETIRIVFNLLRDEESKRQFLAHLQYRLYLNTEVLPIPSFTDQYFPRELITLRSNEVFIDSGAYDGDTLKSFLNVQDDKFKKYVAFEPDPTNFQKLTAFTDGLSRIMRGKIFLHKKAVAHKKGKVLFNITGGSSSNVSESGSVRINCASIDEEVYSLKPTYIKLDVEGQEQNALRGAKNVISDFHPVVGVCVYHLPDDLWNIPLFLHRLYPGYSLYLRTHDYDGLELVLYAIPRERSIKKH